MTDKSKSFNNTVNGETVTLELWSKYMLKMEEEIAKNLSMKLYSDNSWLDKPYIPPTLWVRTKNNLRTAKERISNAWAALKGDLDYDYWPH